MKLNTKNQIIGFVSLLLINVLASAQPNYKLSTYRPYAGKKAGHYNSQANRFQKRGEFNKAVANATRSLKIANKKSQIVKAHIILQENYEMAISDNLAAIEDLEQKSSSFKNDMTVTYRANIVNLYSSMEAYNRILRRLPKDVFKPQKRKDSGLEINIENFSKQLSVAKSKFEKGKEEAAEMHYNNANDFVEQDGIDNNKAAARRYQWANMYVEDFKDANIKYKEARKNGTTRMGILEFKNSSHKEHLYGNVASALADMITSRLLNDRRYKELKFFQIMTRSDLDNIIAEQKLSISGLIDESTTTSIGNLKGVQVLLVGKITDISISKNKNDPKNEKIEKEIVLRQEEYVNSEGKKKKRDVKGKVRATLYTYSKEAHAIVIGSYKIISVLTGEIIKTKAVTGKARFYHRWGNVSGDKRALNYTQKKLVGKQDKAYPPDGSLVSDANRNLSRQLINGIIDFAVLVGK